MHARRTSFEYQGQARWFNETWMKVSSAAHVCVPMDELEMMDVVDVMADVRPSASLQALHVPRSVEDALMQSAFKNTPQTLLCCPQFHDNLEQPRISASSVPAGGVEALAGWVGARRGGRVVHVPVANLHSLAWLGGFCKCGCTLMCAQNVLLGISCRSSLVTCTSTSHLVRICYPYGS